MGLLTNSDGRLGTTTFVAIKKYITMKDNYCNMPIPTPLLPLLNYQTGVLATKGCPATATMQPVQERPDVSQPIQSPSPKFEITGRHIANQPWNDHANYFAALEDDNDETVAASNISKGYFGKDDIGRETGIPTKQHNKPVHILNISIPSCFVKYEKPEQGNKMVTPFFYQTADGQNVLGIPL